jgi:hypothetical protein
MSQPWAITDARVGYRYIRLLAGRIAIPVTVTAVDAAEGLITVNENWTFSERTGREVDTHLGWDGVRTGSCLVPSGIPLREYLPIPSERLCELESWREGR